jgi:predicted PurR-regulated permease PerM
MIVNDMKNIKLDNNWKIVFGIAAIMLVLYLVWFFRVIIAYALIAVVISFIGDPLMELLKKIRIKNWIMPVWLRAMITLVTFFGVIAGLAMLFAPLIGQEIKLISQINPTEIAEKLKAQVNTMQVAMDASNPATNQETITHYLVAKVQEVMSFSWVSGLFGNFFGVISSLVVGIFAVLFMSFFFLKDGFLFTRIVFTLTPDRHMDKVKNVMEHTPFASPFFHRYRYSKFVDVDDGWSFPLDTGCAERIANWSFRGFGECCALCGPSSRC